MPRAYPLSWATTQPGRVHVSPKTSKLSPELRVKPTTEHSSRSSLGERLSPERDILSLKRLEFPLDQDVKPNCQPLQEICLLSTPVFRR